MPTKPYGINFIIVEVGAIGKTVAGN